MCRFSNFCSYLSILVLIEESVQIYGQMATFSVVPQETQADECKVNAVKILGDLSCDALESSKEEMGKFAVFLLNCQRRIEDRSEFPCTDSMALKECTIGMSETVWSSYMQMHRSAQSICEQIQHELWHKRARNAVNDLVQQSSETSEALHQLQIGQENLHDITKDTYETTKSFKAEALNAHEALKNSTVVIMSDVEKIEGNQKQALATQETLMESFARAQSDVLEFHRNISVALTQYDLVLQRLYAMTESIFKLEELSLQYYLEWHTVGFYAICVPIGILSTSTTRTMSARPMVLITLTIHLLLEWVFRYLVVSRNFTFACGVACTLASLSWASRKLLIIVELFLVCWAAWTHVDENSLTREKLFQLERTTQQILVLLRDSGGGIQENPMNDAVQFQNCGVMNSKKIVGDSETDSEYAEATRSDSDCEVTDLEDSDDIASICSDVSSLHQAECHSVGGYTLRSRTKLERGLANPVLEFETAKDFTELWAMPQGYETVESDVHSGTAVDNDSCYDAEEHF
eukprot:m.181335 g.181335  ORF g.181335 m.181335 type:complete len:520 (+) comp18450_c0_seq4:392-1951(+)